jgi:hypothetical protein
MSGCDKRVTENDLIPDRDLGKRAKRWKMKQDERMKATASQHVRIVADSDESDEEEVSKVKVKKVKREIIAFA